MAATYPFTPGNSTAFTVTSSSAVIALPAGSGDVLYLANNGTAIVFIALGSSTVLTAVNTGGSFALLPGVVELININLDQAYIAAISTGATLYICRGYGT
jgi:hypothetical protein